LVRFPKDHGDEIIIIYLGVAVRDDWIRR